MRWIIFDNQKIGGNLGPYRFLRNFAKPLGDPIVMDFHKGRAFSALAIVDKRLSSNPYLLGAEPTIADISMTKMSAIRITRPTSSASTSQRSTKASAPGSTASRRCRVGRILMI